MVSTSFPYRLIVCFFVRKKLFSIFVFLQKKEFIIIVFMGKKELLKQLIAGFQASLSVEVYPRELSLPVDSGKIITVPGVRRCGKSSLFLLVINQLMSRL